MMQKNLRHRAEREVPAGHVRVEIISGPEGPCLAIGTTNRGGKRIAGPKPWGGGTLVCVFDVPAEELQGLAPREAGAAGEGAG